MELFFLQIAVKYFGLLCMSILSIVGVGVGSREISVDNNSIDKANAVMASVTDYTTTKLYNSKIPSNKTNIIVNGVEGVTYYDKNGNANVLRTKTDEVIEIGTGAYGEYHGDTTGYGADCLGCSGNVSCRTKEGAIHNLTSDGIYYEDSQYGSVRIVAADHRVFGCGTIIEINDGRNEPYLGIVMDTGSGMRANWDNFQKVHIDIAFSTQNDPEVYSVTNRNNTAQFSVQRWGW